MFISSKLQINHNDDNLFLTGFTFDEVQTLEMEDFCRDFVAMSFDQHGSTVVLDMMRSMSYLPGMGLGQRQHRPSEFMAILDHDVPFELGFIPIEVDYRYMVQLRKERVRPRLTHTSFDYLVLSYTTSLVDYFVRASELQTYSDEIIGGLNTVKETELQHLVHQLQFCDGAPGTSVFALVAPSSPDRMNLMKLYFPDEIDEHGTFAEIGDKVDGIVPHDEYIDEMLALSISHIDRIFQPKLALPFDLFGVSVIEVTEEIHTAPAQEFSVGDVVVVDDLFEGPVGLVEGVSDFMNPPLSFDVLLRFVSRYDDVHDSSFMDLSIFEYLLVSYDITLSAPSSPTSQIFDIDYEIAQHDSDDNSFFVFYPSPIDQRVSLGIGDTEIVDFGTTDQPRELRIGLDLSTNERDDLAQLLRSFLDVFAWSYEDMPGLDPSIV